jgi:hypothetical protein
VTPPFPDELNQVIGFDNLTLPDRPEVLHVHDVVGHGRCWTGSDTMAAQHTRPVVYVNFNPAVLL